MRDAAVHLEVLENIMAYSLSAGFSITDLNYSPIKGPEGNIEYLLYLEKINDIPENMEMAKEEFNTKYRQLAEDIVKQAHENLDK